MLFLKLKAYEWLDLYSGGLVDKCYDLLWWLVV